MLQSIGDGIQKTLDRLCIIKGDCPECGKPLYEWKHRHPDGSIKGEYPVCMKCGYKDIRRKEDVQTEKIYTQSLNNRVLNAFKMGSIITDKSLFDKRLDQYKSTTRESEVALTMAHEFVNRFFNGEEPHFVLSGNTGTGKSHLAMGICWEIIEKSNYQKKCLFINYRELLEQLKFSFNDEQARKAIQGNLMADIKTIDLVVVDDLGAELGGGTEKGSTTYNNDTIYAILEARQNQATIITSNLNAREISDAYGDRIVSRMLSNSRGLVAKFRKTKDERVN